ncbi:MAG: hypothetical protein WBD34_17285 [Burkholderiaceae bacterium]
MDANLELIAEAIAKKKDRIHIFFRNDDGGWAQERLDNLWHLMLRHGLPMDVAVIPDALTEQIADRLHGLHQRSTGMLRFHQHGFRHRNHEFSDRKSEFGISRTFEQQLTDIDEGRTVLGRWLGNSVDPFFTPPWNRCTDVTISALHTLGFQVISRITGSDSLVCNQLKPIDVSIDWLKSRKGQRMTWAQFCNYAKSQFEIGDTIGIMLHHEHMDTPELERFQQFVKLLMAQPNVQFCSMKAIFGCAVQIDSR